MFNTQCAMIRRGVLKLPNAILVCFSPYVEADEVGYMRKISNNNAIETRTGGELLYAFSEVFVFQRGVFSNFKYK